MSLVAIVVDSSSYDAVSSEMQQFLKSKDLIGKSGSYFGDPIVHVYDANGDLVCTVTSTIKLADLSEMLRVAERSQQVGFQRGLAEKMREIRSVLDLG